MSGLLSDCTATMSYSLPRLCKQLRSATPRVRGPLAPVAGAGIVRHTAAIHPNGCNCRLLHTSPPRHKLVPFNLPDIGEGIAEVEILAWHVKAGDRVSQFDKLLEVQSDKATVDITSRYDGVVVALNYKVGELAPTGKPLLTIETGEVGASAADSAAAATDAAQQQDETGDSSVSGQLGGRAASPASPGHGSGSGVGVRGLATPAVRRLAREHDLSLQSIVGTGKDGRVTKDDVLLHLGSRSAAAPPPASSRDMSPGSGLHQEPSETTGPVVEAAVSSSLWAGAASAGREDRTMPVRGIQRAMAKSMTAAWQAPHFGLCEEVLVDALMDVRAALKPVAEARGLKFSYLPVLLKAASLALEVTPSLNATVAPDASEVIYRGHHNIGVAMDTPRGLLVPNIKAVDQMTLLELAQELARLQSLAVAGKLGADDLAGGTFTLSNVGTIGGTYASPVLFAPQVAIGAIGKIALLPRFASTLPSAVAQAAGARSGGGAPSAGGAILPVHVMSVSWVADHRVVDGATLARFSNAFKGFVETPASMLALLR